MVGHRPVDQDEIQAMMESGGLKLLARTSLKTMGWIQARLYWKVTAQIEKSVTEFMGTLTVKKRKEDGSMEELRPRKIHLTSGRPT